MELILGGTYLRYYYANRIAVEISCMNNDSTVNLLRHYGGDDAKFY